MLDDELAALWRKDVQRERSPAFELAVMRQLEESLFRRAFAVNIAIVVAATLLTAICAPVLVTVWRQTFAHFLSAPVVAIFLMAFSFALSKTPLVKGK